MLGHSRVLARKKLEQFALLARDWLGGVRCARPQPPLPAGRGRGLRACRERCLKEPLARAAAAPHPPSPLPPARPPRFPHPQHAPGGGSRVKAP